MQRNESLVALWLEGEQVGYRQLRGGMPVYSRDLYGWSGRAIEADLETPWTLTHDLDARPVFVGDPVFWRGQRWVVEGHDERAVVLRRGDERETMPKGQRLQLRLIEARR